MSTSEATRTPIILGAEDHEYMHDLLSEHRRSAIEKAFQALNAGGICYGIVNGAFDYPDRVGRDIDVLVAWRDVESATRLVAQAFTDAGMEVKCLFTPYDVVQIHAYCFTDEFIWGAEIDLITEYIWAGCLLCPEMTSESQVLVRGELKIDPWGNFVKAVLIQLLCGSLEKAKKNAIAGNSVWSDSNSGKAILNQLRTIYRSDMAEKLWAMILAGDGEGLLSMRGELRRETVLGCIRKYNPLQNLRNLFLWGTWLIKRKTNSWRAVPVVAILGDDEQRISKIIARLESAISARYVFVTATRRDWRAELAAADIHPKSETRGGFGLLQRFWSMCKLMRLAKTVLKKDQQKSREFRLPLLNQFWGDVVKNPSDYGMAPGILLQWLIKLLPAPDCVVLLRGDADDEQRRWSEFCKLFPKTEVIDDSKSEDSIVQELEYIVIDSFLRSGNSGF